MAERARAEKVDAIIWIRREGIGHDTALRLRDAGIRFGGINIGGVVGGFCRCEVRRRQAIETILHEWRTGAKLDTAIFLRAGKETLGEKERIARLRAIAARVQMRLEVENVPEGRISRTLKSLCAAKTRSGGLLTASAAAILGSRAPDTVADVLSCCRLALIDGPMEFPFLERPPEAAIDLVTIGWQRVARRIAQDVLSGEAFQRAETIAFEAKPYLQSPLSRFP